MNNKRREAIQQIIDQLTPIEESITDLQGEEQDYYDNMPEGLQESERGGRAQEAADNLDNAVSAIDELRTYLEEAQA